MAPLTIPAPTTGTISPAARDVLAAAVFACTDADSLRACGVRVIQHAQALQALTDGRQPTSGNLIIEARNVLRSSWAMRLPSGASWSPITASGGTVGASTSAALGTALTWARTPTTGDVSGRLWGQGR